MSAYLDLVKSSIADIRQDLPHLIDIGDRMAAPLLRGGNLFTPQIGTYWPNEFSGRAGGLMGMRPATYATQSENDVAFTTLPDPRRANLRENERWQRLIASPAKIFINGRPEDLSGATPLQRLAGFTGGAGADEGLCAHGNVAPLAP